MTSGIIPPLITPLKDRDTLDRDGLERLIERLVTGGVHGLFIIGTTGEGPSLGYRLRRELITETCKLVRGRLPVFVGITDTAFVESVNIAKHSADAGATALVAAPPYYLPEGQPELLEYIRHLLPELPLPFYLYNMPSLTKVSFDIDTVRALQDEPKIHGIKDSSGNMVYFHRLCQMLKERPDWSVLMGPEELLLDAVLAGGHGGVNGGANVFPQLYVALYNAVSSGQIERVSTPPPTACDALQTPATYPINFAVLQARGVTGLSVSEAEVRAAMRLAFERLHLVVEPGGAAALAAVLAGKVPLGAHTLVTLSGGNVDPAQFAAVLTEAA